MANSCAWPAWGQCGTFLDPPPALGHCGCFAIFPQYHSFCSDAAYSDANVCNQDARCFWGPQDDPGCMGMISESAGRLLTSGELEDSPSGIVYLRAPPGTCTKLNSHCEPGLFIVEGSHSEFCCAECPYICALENCAHARHWAPKVERSPSAVRRRPGTFSVRDATFCTRCAKRPHPMSRCV